MKHILSINEFFFNGKNNSSNLLRRDYYNFTNNDFKSIYTDSDWDNIIKLLEKDCGDFLIELMMSDSILYRGVRDKGDYILNGLSLKNTRRTRYPTDTRKDVSEVFDTFFEEKFGVKVRSKGVFTSKDPLVTQSYGQYSNSRNRTLSYIFLPIGDYRYFYNKDIRDLFSDLEKEDWYSEYDFVGDDYYNSVENKWWNIYGEPKKPLEFNRFNTGGGKGDYKYVGDNKVWVPEISLDNFKEIEKDRVKEVSDNRIQEIVNGYKYSDLSDVSDQEITFICSKYYLLDDAFTFKLKDYLESKKGISKFTNHGHS